MNKKKKPYIAICFLVLIILISVFSGVIAPYEPQAMDSSAICAAPSKEHLLGTDSMGRDMLSMIMHGGKVSLFIGIASGLISTVIAVIYGTISGLAGRRTDDFLMRICEILLSIPSILLVIFLQALWGNPGYVSLSVVIGITGWMNMSKLIRSEVRQIGESDYILAAKTMKASFWYIMWRHLFPAFISSIMYMVVTNIGQAMIMEATLSFLGLGLPLTVISWGSLLSMSQKALMTGSWWIIVLPGIALIASIISITEIGEYIRKENNRRYSNI